MYCWLHQHSCSKGAHSEPLTLSHQPHRQLPFLGLYPVSQEALYFLLSATSKLRETFATHISQVYNTLSSRHPIFFSLKNFIYFFDCAGS